MPRDYGRIRTDMWADDHWRTLTPGAQWLYEYLLTSPTLNHVGVADWRPTRIAALARGLTADMVRKYADELGRERFVAHDDETEEILVRSFLRHDGLLLNPNMWKSIGTAFADVYSKPLRAVIVAEALRLSEEGANGLETSKGGKVYPWQSKHLRTLLHTPMDTPPETPSDTPSSEVVHTGSPPTPTPTPTPTEEASLPQEARRKETALPKDWAPTAEHIRRAKESGIDLMDQVENFRLHAETHDRRAANWNGAFTTWLKKSKPAPVEAAPRKRRIFKADE